MPKNNAAQRINISSGGAYESVFGYSRAVRFGKDIHVSGTCAPAGHEKSGAYAQARAAQKASLEQLRSTRGSWC